nr:MAG TPA: hypothetical protein [Caudoviricetes sp.]
MTEKSEYQIAMECAERLRKHPTIATRAMFENWFMVRELRTSDPSDAAREIYFEKDEDGNYTNPRVADLFDAMCYGLYLAIN